MPTRILLADDHRVVRQGLKFLLEREGFEVVGEASDGMEAVRLAQSLQPDVAILDLSMPLLDGLAAASEILCESPGTRSILLTMYTEGPYVLKAIRAGIRGYVAKTQMANDLFVAIREVVEGKIYLSPAISESIVQSLLNKTDLPPDSLSPREVQVLQLLAGGKAVKDTAGILGITIKTVGSHRYRIMTKLNIHDTAGLVRYAVRRGLIQP